MILLACAAERRAAVAPGPAAAAVDPYFLPTGPVVATHHNDMQWPNGSIWNRQDGQTPYRYIDTAANYASSVNNSLQQTAAYT